MKQAVIKTQPCPTCNNRGSIPDRGAGEILRREREARAVPRVGKKAPATGLIHHLDLSESYVIDLENGVRPFTWTMIDRYREAVEAAVQARLAMEEVTT